MEIGLIPVSYTHLDVYKRQFLLDSGHVQHVQIRHSLFQRFHFSEWAAGSLHYIFYIRRKRQFRRGNQDEPVAGETAHGLSLIHI